MSLRERFFGKVIRGQGDACWQWIGAANGPYGDSRRGGYGVLAVPGVDPRRNHMRLAHRVAWELMRGPVPPGLFVLHSCDNRRCVNPGHLFLGTARDNTRDMMSKGRHAAQRGVA